MVIFSSLFKLLSVIELTLLTCMIIESSCYVKMMCDKMVQFSQSEMITACYNHTKEMSPDHLYSQQQWLACKH